LGKSCHPHPHRIPPAPGSGNLFSGPSTRRAQTEVTGSFGALFPILPRLCGNPSDSNGVWGFDGFGSFSSGNPDPRLGRGSGRDVWASRGDFGLIIAGSFTCGLLPPDSRNQLRDTDKGDRPTQVVGDGRQAELGAHVFQPAHQECALAHPLLHRAERVLDALAALVEYPGPRGKSFRHPVRHGLVLVARNLAPGRAGATRLECAGLGKAALA